MHGIEWMREMNGAEIQEYVPTVLSAYVAEIHVERYNHERIKIQCEARQVAVP